MEYGATSPVAELVVRLSVSSLEDLRLEVGLVEGSATWEERVSRATRPRDVYVALMISGHLVHFTNMQSIKKRVYPDCQIRRRSTVMIGKMTVQHIITSTHCVMNMVGPGR